MEVPSHVTQTKRRVRYQFLYAIASFIILQTFVPWIHEVGHGAVCAFYGLNPTINLSILGNSMSTCDDRESPEQNFTIAIAGGLTGGAAAFAIGWFTRNKWKWLWVAGLSIAVAHFGLAVMESFFLQFYLYEQAITGQIVGLITAVTFVLMTKHYIIDPARTELKKPNEV